MTTPDYNPSVPKQTDDIASSQPDFLANFQSLFDVFANNHVAFNESKQGYHDVVQLFEQKSSLQTTTSELSIYSKKVTGQTDQVFLRRPGNGEEIQLTNYQIYPSSSGDAFFTTLPGGVIVYFGRTDAIPVEGQFIFRPTPREVVSCVFSSRVLSFTAYVNFLRNNDGIVDRVQPWFPLGVRNGAIGAFGIPSSYYIAVGVF